MTKPMEPTIVRVVHAQPEPGAHACPVERLVQTAQRFRSEVTLRGNGHGTIDAKSLLAVLKLCVQPPEELTILTNGSDAEEAMDLMASLCRSGILEFRDEGEREAETEGLHPPRFPTSLGP